MTSQERVLKTFAFEKADRMPINYFGNNGVNGLLKKFFNTNDYHSVLDMLNVDFRGADVPYTGKCLFKEKEGFAIDKIYGVYSAWVKHSTGGYWDFSYFPLKDAPDDVIANYPMASHDDFDYSAVAEIIKRHPGRAIYAGNVEFADVINSTGRLMGMEQTLVNLITEDEATLAYIKRVTDLEIKRLERIIEAAKGRIDFVWIGEDLGTQIAPMISVDLYRKVLKPIHKRYVSLAKAYNLPVMVHTCGSSSWAYEDFIEMGVNAVDTLQPEAVNMSPEYLVKKFGGRLAFHGSISTAGPLAYGTPADVEKNVKETCDIYRECNGYMISPTHLIQDNTPLENVLAMYEAAVKYGKY